MLENKRIKQVRTFLSLFQSLKFNVIIYYFFIVSLLDLPKICGRIVGEGNISWPESQDNANGTDDFSASSGNSGKRPNSPRSGREGGEQGVGGRQDQPPDLLPLHDAGHQHFSSSSIDQQQIDSRSDPPAASIDAHTRSNADEQSASSNIPRSSLPEAENRPDLPPRNDSQRGEESILSANGSDAHLLKAPRSNSTEPSYGGVRPSRAPFASHPVAENSTEVPENLLEQTSNALDDFTDTDGGGDQRTSAQSTTSSSLDGGIGQGSDGQENEQNFLPTISEEGIEERGGKENLISSSSESEGGTEGANTTRSGKEENASGPSNSTDAVYEASSTGDRDAGRDGRGEEEQEEAIVTPSPTTTPPPTSTGRPETEEQILPPIEKNQATVNQEEKRPRSSTFPPSRSRAPPSLRALTTTPPSYSIRRATTTPFINPFIQYSDNEGQYYYFDNEENTEDKNPFSQY